MTDSVAAIGNTVTFHFTMKLTDNTVAETTKGQDPAQLELSEESQHDPVEAKLMGSKVGDKHRLELTPEQGYGPRDEAAVVDIDKQRFPGDVEPKEGDIFEFEQANGETVAGLVLGMMQDMVTVDFNHPLAGKQLLVELEVLAVE